jgi:hypothetical protein
MLKTAAFPPMAEDGYLFAARAAARVNRDQAQG